MKKIHQLVLKSYLGPLVLTFFIIIFILMMNFVWRYIDELVGKGLEPMVIIELIMYATINMIPMGLPLAILLATIMTMGNLGENYELLAMKSAGMSLMQIMKPLFWVIGIISFGSFFIVNDLVPFANKKMFSIIYDIKQQNEALEFQDGLFFNGIDDMSIRVEKQDPKTKLLTGVLIYDNRARNGDMTTTIADSGYIRLSDDKKYLLVTLYNGETYEQTRNYQWYTKSSLRHHKFERQEGKIPMSGFDFQRSDENMFGNNSQTMDINDLQHNIDSLDLLVNNLTATAYNPLLREQIFARDPDGVAPPDSIEVDRSNKTFGAHLLDSIPRLNTRAKNRVYESALRSARNSRNMFSFDESSSKEALNQLYRSKNEWHRKLTLPISILIFFLIGAPLGAIIRKGGLGMPIVISVIFFVIYYIISISGEKFAKEGTWSSLLGMWISAIILTPLAIYLSHKANNDSALLDIDWYIGRYKHYRDKLISKLPEKWQMWIAERDERQVEKRAARRLQKEAKKAKQAAKKQQKQM
ncbi:MAG: LptF/LptG family permease [Alistipes sp.]|nr:LptF/LptG family permease [Alistipes sp.]